jgi:hypothetical protein
MDTDIYNLCKLSNHCLNCHAHDRVTLMNTRCLDVIFRYHYYWRIYCLRHHPKTVVDGESAWWLDPINPYSCPWVPAATFCSLPRAKKPMPFYLPKLITWKICTQQSTKVLRTELKNKWERASASPTRTLII